MRDELEALLTRGDFEYPQRVEARAPPRIAGRVPPATEQRAEPVAQGRFEQPQREGTGTFGAAAGLYVRDAAANVAGWPWFLDRCVPTTAHSPPDALAFNRTITLRDTWAKTAKR